MSNSDWISPNYSMIPPGDADDDYGGADRNDTTIITSIEDATNCSMPYPLSRGYNVVTATICGLYFMFAVLCTFFGYRCFKALMFFTGFIFASIVVYLVRGIQSPTLLNLVDLKSHSTSVPTL
jgi:hypothetical protein